MQFRKFVRLKLQLFRYVKVQPKTPNILLNTNVVTKHAVFHKIQGK